jgi:hypothetical protein
MALSEPKRRHSRKLVAASFALLLALQCNVYDSSLLGSGAAHGGDVTIAGQFGTAGTPGLGDAGASGEGAFAGELNGGGGAGATAGAEAAGAMPTGGAMDHGGSAGHSSGAGGKGGGGSIGGVTGAGGTGVGAGAGAGAGSGGLAGMAGSAGSPAQTGAGCAKLSVPLTASGDKAHFVISLTSPADLSGATISMRLYVKAGTGGSIFNYVQDSGTFHFLGVPAAQRRLLSASSGWSTLSWDVGAEPDSGSTGIVKTSIKNIGIELNAQPSSAWTNPTIIYVDSITVASPALAFTFDATASVYTTPTTSSAPAQALWLNNGTSDTTATGASVSWQAACP